MQLLLSLLLLTAGADGSAGATRGVSTAVPVTAGERQARTVSITTWEFQQDPHDVGVREQWFSVQAKPTLAQNITSPGTWQAKGVAKLGGYNGVGWYRQQLAAPPVPPGGSLWLWIGGAPGGVLRSANVYANDLHIGRHVGYVDPLEMELTPALGLNSAAGLLTLAVAIDSRWNRTEDPLWASGALGNCFADGGCGGMLGHAQLQVRERAWVEDSVTTSCALDLDLIDAGGRGSGAWRCTVEFSLGGTVHSAADRVALTICESTGEACVSTAPAAVPPPSDSIQQLRDRSETNGRMKLSLVVSAAKLWTPGTRHAQANLYVANVTLTGLDDAGRSITATRTTRFGIRSIRTDGPRIIWNGEPLFLRGYGDDAQYGFTGAPPMNKEYYTAQLTAMKRLGFLYLRAIIIIRAMCLDNPEMTGIYHTYCNGF